MANDIEYRLGYLTGQADAIGKELQIHRKDSKVQLESVRRELHDEISRLATSAGLYSPRITQLEKSQSERKGFWIALWLVITTVASIASYLVGATGMGNG